MFRMRYQLPILTNEAELNCPELQYRSAYPIRVAATVRSQAESSSGYELDAAAKPSAPPSRDLTVAATLNTHLSAIDAIGVARAHFERDFAALIEQEPRLVRLALNEAEALAWQTGFPELVFPILAQEKADKVSSWHERQQSVRQKRPLHAFAA